MKSLQNLFRLRALRVWGVFTALVASVGICWGQDSILRATVKTDMGDMQFELWPDAAPQTVANFVFLAEAGFYDGTGFHRIIKDFMVQGGDPSSRYSGLKGLYGSCGPGYGIPDEFHNRGIRVVDAALDGSTELIVPSTSGILVGQGVRGDGIPQDAQVMAVSDTGVTLSLPATKTGESRVSFGTQHVRGVLSMAHSAAANSAGSQFFIVTKDAPHLDGGYAAFGRLISGDDVLTKLSEVEVGVGGGGEASVPVKMPQILSVRTLGLQSTSKVSFSGRTFGGGLFPVSGVDVGAWGLLSDFPVSTQADAQDLVNDREQTRSELFRRLFAMRPSGHWTATLGAVGKTTQSCSLKVRLTPDNLLGLSNDVSMTVSLSDRGGGVFSGTGRDVLIASGQLPKKEGETDSYDFRKSLTGILVERRSWQGVGNQVRVVFDVTQRVYNRRTKAEVTAAVSSAKFVGFSSDAAASVGSRFTAALSAPGDLLADGGFDFRTGQYNPVPVMAGNGYFTSTVSQGMASTAVRLANDRAISMTVPARMSGLRCLIPVSYAANSAGAFARLSGQFELGAAATLGEIDWVHWPKGASDRISTAFYGRSSVRVEPYAASPSGRLGLFASADTVASLKLFGQIAKVLSVGPVPKRGSQVLTELPSAMNKTPAKLTVDPVTGLFTGSFVEQMSGKAAVKRTINGVLLQQSRLGKGYSPRESEVVAVDLSVSSPTP